MKTRGICMAVAPCKDCDRKGCGSYHDECPDYLKYKEIQKKENEERKRKMQLEADYTSVVIERSIRYKKDRTRFKQR